MDKLEPKITLSQKPKPTVQLLPSGYWHVRWSNHLWCQWQKGRPCHTDDGHGWFTAALAREANKLTNETSDDAR